MDVIENVKSLLRKTSEDWGDTPYKSLKLELIDIYAHKGEELFQQACDLVMTDKPSALFKQIADLICDKTPACDGCCCIKVISGIWRSKLPTPVRQAVASVKCDY